MPGAIPHGGLVMDGSLNRYYHQFDIYLGCHVILAVTNKNTYGYILRNTDNHKLESFDILVKDSKVGKRSQHETKMKQNLGHRDGVGFVHVCIYTIQLVLITHMLSNLLAAPE